MATFQNLKGTTCSSFKLGQKGLVLTSSAITSDVGKEAVEKYKKRLFVVDEEGNKAKVFYDTDIPAGAIRCMIQDDNTVSFTLWDDDTPVVTFKKNTSAVQFEVNEGETAEAGDIVVMKDPNGVITTSKKKILEKSGLPDSIENYLKVSEETWNSDDKVPTMATVVKYVGDLTGILALRTDGKLPESISGD